MQNISGNMLEKIQEVLEEPLGYFFHRFLKYEVNIGIALIYSEILDKRCEIIKFHIRDTDKPFRISKYLSVVFFQYTDDSNEVKAACENLLHNLGDEKAIVAYTEFYRDKDKNPELIINRLYHIFEQALRENVNIESDKEFMKEYEKYHIVI